jgi:hypothetical protein
MVYELGWQYMVVTNAAAYRTPLSITSAQIFKAQLTKWVLHIDI